MKHTFFIAVLFMTFETASGSTWYVDQSVTLPGKGNSWKTAFKTIQDGIDAADHKDTVLVAEGTYVENIRFKGKNIILRSTEPLSSKIVENTIIDGKKAGSVVTFSGTENRSCVLSGFTIRNGNAQSGGGILGNGALAAIRNNTITSNSASEDGGGLSGCNGTIQRNTISTNQAAINGGGLYQCHATIQDNTISGNSAQGNGGGLADCDGTIRNNVISGNEAHEIWPSGSGGGLYECDGAIENNEITANSTEGCGGGLGTCAGAIQNNTVSRNSAVYGGGGLFECEVTIQNNVITHNWVDLGNGGGLYECDGTIRNNVITDNRSEMSSGGGLSGCHGIIQANTISRNWCEVRGGGLAFCDGTIQNNMVTRNSTFGDGGGMSSCDGTIQNNTIARNGAGTGGGGLASCDGTILNNTIANNNAMRWGGGLAWCSGPIQNNTITGNSAGSNGGGMSYCGGGIRNCIIWGNTGEDEMYNSNTLTYSCVQGWHGGEGNIFDDPRFVDRDGPDNDPETYEDNDYRLSAGSPCIDAGDNAGLNPPGFDLDGNLRIVFGEHSVTVDMGAYEYDSGTIEIREILRLGASAVRLTWKSQPNDTYDVWSRSDLPTGTWTEEESVPSHGAETPWTDAAATGQMKFYRVEMK